MNIKIKRGDTLALPAVRTEANVPVAIDLGDVLTCQVRSKTGTLVATCTVEKLDQTTFPGRFVIRADTATWPLGVHIFDVKRVAASGVIAHSESHNISVLEPVTT